MPTTFFLTPTSVFPPGTTVHAYIARNRIYEQAPAGSPAVSTMVESDGAIAFPGLTEDTAYVAYAFVGGAHRYIAFRTTAPSSTTGPAGATGPIGPAGPASPVPLIFSQPGVIAPSTGRGRAFIPFDSVLVNATAAVGVAPLGASIIAEPKRNLGVLFTTQANRPTVPAGGNLSTPAVPDIGPMPGGSWLTVDIAQVGSAVASSTANTTNASPNLASVSPTTGWQNGMIVTGAGIPAGTTILSGAGTATMVMSQNATATATGVAIAGTGAGAEFSLTLYLQPLSLAPFSETIQAEGGLLSYWRQGDASLPAGADDKGANNGVYVGSPLLNQSSLVLSGSTAVKYNGSTQYMQVASALAPDLRVPSPTLEAWVSIPSAPASADRRILSVNDNVGYIGMNASRQPFVVFYDNNEQKITAASAVPLNTPTHIMGTFDSASFTHKLYVNGTEAGSFAGSRPLNYTGAASNAAVGSETGGGAAFCFNGTIDEAAVYSGALPSTRALAHYAKGTSG